LLAVAASSRRGCDRDAQSLPGGRRMDVMRPANLMWSSTAAERVG